eukprot:365266-Chlamydomonas_euryale.AAC.4
MTLCSAGTDMCACIAVCMHCASVTTIAKPRPETSPDERGKKECRTCDVQDLGRAGGSYKVADSEGSSGGLAAVTPFLLKGAHHHAYDWRADTLLSHAAACCMALSFPHHTTAAATTTAHAPPMNQSVLAGHTAPASFP